MNEEYLAEVIASASGSFLAECRELGGASPLGGLVKVDGEPAILGIVIEVSTGPRDQNRRVVAYGLPPEELFNEQPQLQDLLATTITVQVVGHVEPDGRMRQFLPPYPAGLHHFVRACSPEEIRSFTAGGDYLRTLLTANRPDVDALLIAAVRQAARVQPDQHAFLVRAGQELVRLCGDDYDRLESLLRRMSDD